MLELEEEEEEDGKVKERSILGDTEPMFMVRAPPAPIMEREGDGGEWGATGFVREERESRFGEEERGGQGFICVVVVVVVERSVLVCGIRSGGIDVLRVALAEPSVGHR